MQFINITEQGKRHLRQLMMNGINSETLTAKEVENALNELKNYNTQEVSRLNRIQTSRIVNQSFNNRMPEKFLNYLVWVPSAMLSSTNGSSLELIENFKMPVTHEFSRRGKEYVSDGTYAVCVEESFETHNAIYEEVKNELRALLEAKKYEESRNTEPTGL